MNIEESLIALKNLLSLIEEESAAQCAYISAQKHLDEVTYSYATKLSAFDKDNKANFIVEKIGEEPIAPHGLIKLVFPIYLSKKKKYNEEKQNYDRAYPLAEAAYREKYRSERSALAAEDEIEQAEAIEQAKTNAEELKLKWDLAVQALSEDCTLNLKFKDSSIVKKLIEFFEEGRVETLKEAINLWYDEKRKDEEEARAEAHRQEVLALEEERVRAARAAEEYARQAAADLREAAEMASYYDD